jgi:hypothetical protein
MIEPDEPQTRWKSPAVSLSVKVEDRRRQNRSNRSSGHTMHDVLPPQTPKRRRWLPRGLLLLGALAVGTVAYLWHQHDRTERELEAVIAATDRLDPGWRLADLEAARPEVAFDANSADLIGKLGPAAIAVLNKGKVRGDLNAITEELKGLPPTARLDAQQTARLRACLAPLLGPLTEARKLADLPSGRRPINLTPGVSESLRHVDDGGILIWLLSEDVVLRLQESDVPAAWRSCQAVHHISRFYAGEPMAAVQTVCVAQRGRALRLMERVLAQGEVSAADLKSTQRLLDEETSEAPLLVALRSHRAWQHHLFSQLAVGRISLAEFQQQNVGSFASPTWKQEVEAFLDRGQIKPAHIWTLRHYNEAVAIAKRPLAEIEPALEKLVAEADPPRLAMSFNLKHFAPYLSPRKVQSELGCARAALAVERYRQKHKRWPAALDDLVADGLLDAVPTDGYDGRPLRYRPTKDGVVVYSVAADGQGDGAALDRQPIDPERLEFRLWDVERRRR